MHKHIEAAVSAEFGRDHLNNVSVHEVLDETGTRALWVDVVYRGFAAGPDLALLQRVMDNVADVSCASDPRAVVNFVAEEDLMAMAAE
ncbi:hypothetical protein HKCCE2091_02075 [Rhodobacterales bacterium HKCCE2091]|nr:hypothetical protein [Rhodobacterales bacterium HKCCE2091]